MTESDDLNDELRPEYDLSKMKGMVKGKYCERIKREGFRIVPLDSDVTHTCCAGDDASRVPHLSIDIAERNNDDESKPKVVTPYASPQ
jgi:hypothetical protein